MEATMTMTAMAMAMATSVPLGLGTTIDNLFFSMPIRVLQLQ